MKKTVLCVLTLLLLLSCSALAQQDYLLDPYAVITGMDQQNWAQGYQPSVSGGVLTVCLPLTCESSGTTVTASLELADPAHSPLKVQKLQAHFTRTNDIYPVRLQLKLLDNARDGDYAATVTVSGKSKDGKALRSEFPIVFRVRGMSTAEPVRPVFEGVSSNLIAGENGSITLSLRNGGTTTEMRDIVLHISDPTGSILPETSDRIECGSLMPGEQTEVFIPVSVLPTAEITLHSVTLDLTCTAADSTASYSETFTLPVTQEIRLEQGGIQMASSMTQGEMTSITIPLMNMGRGTLRNVSVTVMMPGITDRQTVLVGSISPGDTAQARVNLNVPKTSIGEYSGTCTVTCEDDWCNSESFDLPISCSVTEPVLPDAISQAIGEDPDIYPKLVRILGVGCAVLLISFILQGTILRRKLHRTIEERL